MRKGMLTSSSGSINQCAIFSDAQASEYKTTLVGCELLIWLDNQAVTDIIYTYTQHLQYRYLQSTH